MQALGKRRKEEEEEKKKRNFGSQGCAAARDRQPKIAQICGNIKMTSLNLINLGNKISTNRYISSSMETFAEKMQKKKEFVLISSSKLPTKRVLFLSFVGSRKKINTLLIHQKQIHPMHPTS